MSVDKCPICGKFRFSFSVHRCPPAWSVRIAESDNYYDGGEPRRLYADTADEAAEEFAAHWDSEDGDFPLLRSGDEIRVVVMRSGEHVGEHEFLVGGQTVPEYVARDIPAEMLEAERLVALAEG